MRIEGCLWHLVVESTGTDQSSDDATGFAKYMTPTHQRMTRHNASMTDGEQQTAPLTRDNITRYRVRGGVADGLVFDVSEEGGDIRLRLYVPNPALFPLLTSLTTPFTTLMQQHGLVVSLEILNATVTA